MGITFSIFAGPNVRPEPYHSKIHRPEPHRHNECSWKHNRYNFWSSFTGAAVGSFISSTIVNSYVQPQPIVQQLVIIQQPVQVWVPGRYVDQIQPNGMIIRIWIPGHYETR